jgi:hypothetical protein
MPCFTIPPLLLLPGVVCSRKGRHAMSNQFDEIEEDDPVEQQPSEIQSLRAAAKKGKASEQKASKLERENAFLRAGIDPDDPRLGYFYRGYEGEMTADAIRAAATESGFIAPPQQDPAIAAHQAGEAAVTRASSGTEAVFDPQGAVYAMEKAFAEGGVDGMVQAGVQYGLKVAKT